MQRLAAKYERSWERGSRTMAEDDRFYSVLSAFFFNGRESSPRSCHWTSPLMAVQLTIANATLIALSRSLAYQCLDSCYLSQFLSLVFNYDCLTKQNGQCYYTAETCSTTRITAYWFLVCRAGHREIPTNWRQGPPPISESSGTHS
jgi:hypothetical protein